MSKEQEDLLRAIAEENMENFTNALQIVTDLNYTLGNVVSSPATSPLRFAIELGNLEMVKALLERGANPNFIANKNTPLTAAIYKGNIDIVRKLLENEATLTCDNLIEAIKQRNLALVELLLAKNPGLAKLSSSTQETPIEVAVRLWDTNIVEAVIKAGAPLQESLFNFPIEMGNIQMVILLIKKGVPMSAKTVNTALKSDNPELMRTLLKHGAPIPKNLNISKNEMSSAEWVLLDCLVKENRELSAEDLEGYNIFSNSYEIEGLSKEYFKCREFNKRILETNSPLIRIAQRGNVDDFESFLKQNKGALSPEFVEDALTLGVLGNIIKRSLIHGAEIPENFKPLESQNFETLLLVLNVFSEENNGKLPQNYEEQRDTFQGFFKKAPRLTREELEERQKNVKENEFHRKKLKRERQKNVKENEFHRKKLESERQQIIGCPIL